MFLQLTNLWLTSYGQIYSVYSDPMTFEKEQRISAIRRSYPMGYKRLVKFMVTSRQDGCTDFRFIEDVIGERAHIAQYGRDKESGHTVHKGN